MSIPLRSIILCALLGALCAEPLYAQSHFYFGRNKVQYEDFDWHVLRTEHFDIYYYLEAEELASIAAAEAEAAYRMLVHRFEVELRSRVPLMIYATNLHFRQTNTLPGFIPPGVGGFFEFLKGRVVIPADGDLNRFRHVIRHELVHVFTMERISQVYRDHRRPAQVLPPLWFTEGIAEYWSGPPDAQHALVMRDAVASNLLVRLEDLHRIGGFLVYKQGEAVCQFIAEEYGEDRLLRLMENTWRSTDFREVMEYVLREDFRVIADRFDEWIRSHYYPALVDAVPPALEGEGLVTTGFSGKPVHHLWDDGTGMIIFLANRRGHTNVYAVDLDRDGGVTGQPYVLIRGERDHRFEAFHVFESRLDVSANGILAFSTQSGGSDVLHLFDLAERRLVASHRPMGVVALYSPTWHPSGQRIAFTGIDATGFSNLFELDFSSGTLRRLTDDTYDDRDPAWSPDGERIAFSSDRGPSGEGGGRNVFVLETASGTIAPLTAGDRRDTAPRWSPDGEVVLFTSSQRTDGGGFDGQNLWTVSSEVGQDSAELQRLTSFTSGAFDPVWTADGQHFVFGAYDRGRFTVRRLAADSILTAPRQTATVGLSSLPGEVAWQLPRYELDDRERASREPYRRTYSLDIAQGGVATNPIWGTTGGATLAFSDLLGDDRIFVTAYATEVPDGSFMDALNLGVTRIHLGGRTNFGYGAFRFSGLRFDRTDPDADATYPVFFEQLTGGLGVVSYPLTRFQRVDVTTSVAWSRKEVPARGLERDALLAGTSVTFTHDNALYGFNGPVEGWKAQVSIGGTGDVRFGNVAYYTVTADLRHYARLGRDVTFASWGLVRRSAGEEARLHLLGGSWDLRGFPFLRVRGRNQWFTSHELRFTLAEAPSAYIPLLAPFGVANVRGALFADAAHAWNDRYDQRERQLLTGRTLGATGAGLRVNLFGGLVLRYDWGWRFEDGLRWSERTPFRQFFFGYDF